MSAPINKTYDPVGSAIRNTQPLPLTTVGNVVVVSADGHLNAETAITGLVAADGTTITNANGILSAVNSVFLVSALPSASTSKGLRAFVSDSTQTLTAGIGTHVVGAGGNFNPVYSDGTNWIIG